MTELGLQGNIWIPWQPENSPLDKYWIVCSSRVNVKDNINGIIMDQSFMTCISKTLI